MVNGGSGRLHLDDFHLEGDDLAGQRVVEVHFYHSIVNGLDHAGHFSAGGVPEDDQQAGLQFHFAELVAGHGLDVLRVAGAKPTLGLNFKAALVAGLETEQAGFEAGQQAAVTDFEGGRSFAHGGINYVAAGQFQGEVQGDFSVVVDADVGHVCLKYVEWQGMAAGETRARFADHRGEGAASAGVGQLSFFPDRNISRIISAAPTVMALSAILKAGKNQLCCQCTRMKSTTWPCTIRSYRLPSAPPRISASATASSHLSRPRRDSQTSSMTLTPTAMAMKNQRCQPPASDRKLKAAPVL